METWMIGWKGSAEKMKRGEEAKGKERTEHRKEERNG